MRFLNDFIIILFLLYITDNFDLVQNKKVSKKYLNHKLGLELVHYCGEIMISFLLMFTKNLYETKFLILLKFVIEPKCY